jgi:uncharacterized protein (DUF362 family)
MSRFQQVNNNFLERDSAPIAKNKVWTRRRFLKLTATAVGAAAGGSLLGHFTSPKEHKTEVFIAKAESYNSDLRSTILRGLTELGIGASSIRGKRVLLKPNLVEAHKNIDHINTHPLLIRAAVEAFLSLGASHVIVAEAAGHMRDSILVLEESGLAEVLAEDRIPFVDLNESSVVKVNNLGKLSKLEHFYFPEEILNSDIVVSVAKMKTHHWAGVTLSMKNLFGVMPGIVYGWPKNVLHWAGLQECIFDITATLKPNLAIIDGIYGMEGDGPIMGTPIQSNVLVIGKNLPAVDATCARIMGIIPEKISYLKKTSGSFGTIREENIYQHGENIISVRKNYLLLNHIPSQTRLKN